MQNVHQLPENINQNEDFTEEDPLNENKEIELSFKEKVIDVFKNVTLEPYIFLFVLMGVVQINTSQNLYLEKACRVTLAYSDEICDSLRMQTGQSQNVYEKEAQKVLARALTWKTYISATIPCAIALFAGSFSDKTGYRKLFCLVPLIGPFFISINNMIHVYYFYELKLEYLVFSEVIFESITGSWCLAFLTAFAFISNITTDKTRTYRLGLFNFSMTLSFPIGMSLSGVLLKNFGYYGSYGFTTVLFFINMLYVIFVVKDPPRIKEQKEHDGKGFCHMVRVFFNPSNVKETLSMVWKQTPNNRRTRLIVLLCVVSVLFGPLYGEMSIMYMAVRYRFNWDEVKFSVFQTYNFIVHTVGTVFSILVFSKHLQWHDSLLGIVSTFSKIASSFVYCFAWNEKIFYIGPLVEILNGTSLLSMRSLISKLVEPDELGKVNSLIGLVETLMPLVYVPLYTKVYTATMETLPGAVFLMGSAMTLPAVSVLCYLFYEHRKQVKLQKRQNKVAED